ncbi:hypothetical protein CATRI_08390 [Corynebacterium atrinae]|uniref:MmpS family transport accessory protein n=1 Tax=Corynebacterium atrinae TaxID=1336740 RepID=UPI0025B5FD76|nr:MmpS family transport accessory protein [Corynebacterium atrinae]WJY63750.1 hypothetical protein CATRI_08390 [Corynebacterium atrinae]
MSTPRPTTPWFRRSAVIIPLGIVALALILFGACSLYVKNASDQVKEQASDTYDVTYRVDGTSQDVSITYTGPNSALVDESNVSAGWEASATLSGYAAAHLTAANSEAESGEVTCQILVEGTLVSESTAAGPGGTSQCSATNQQLRDASKG